MFYKLCGDDAVKNIILATTKWGEVKCDLGHRRERQLSEEHWKYMLDKGAEMAQFTNTQKSAWTIVDLILKREQANTLLIQEELVDLQHNLPASTAGKALRYTSEELIKAQQETSERLQAEQEVYVNDSGHRTQEHIRSTLRQVQDLQISLSKRISNFLLLTSRR